MELSIYIVNPKITYRLISAPKSLQTISTFGKMVLWSDNREKSWESNTKISQTLPPNLSRFPEYSQKYPQQYGGIWKNIQMGDVACP